MAARNQQLGTTRAKAWILRAAVACASFAPGAALAAELAGVAFAERVTLGDAALTFNNVGVRAVTLLSIRVYVAGLRAEYAVGGDSSYRGEGNACGRAVRTRHASSVHGKE